ncbi:unnamed protein product [Schistosoma rodhaini]|uniref:Phosphodiesterase n=1 Tax=Schistosoma rodhaini TaxID=6188 RepID=A0AA85GDJ2_9TREM|nr:unnamed protein product [Schistosoma rodhaini]
MHNNNKPGIHMSSELDKKRKAYRRCYSIQPDRSRQVHPSGNVMLESCSKIIDKESHILLEHSQQSTQIKQKSKSVQQQQQQTHFEHHYEEGYLNSQMINPSSTTSKCCGVKFNNFGHFNTRSFDAGANDECQFRLEEHRGSNLVLQHITGRRGSFLYRQETNSGHSYYSSRHESITGEEITRYQIDEPIVTPFAQILASLRKVRFNFILLTNVTSTRDSRFGAVQPIQSAEDANSSSHLGCSGSGQNKITASETLEELEWCLERLENIQTHRSVSDMASSKFKKMLNKELSQFADAGQSGKQISEYICSTFLDSKENDPLTATSHSSVISHNNTHGIMSNSINKDITINNHDNLSEMNTCTPSDSIKNSESTGMYLFKSVEPGEINQTTTTTLIDNIDGDTTIGVTGDSSSSNIPHTINSTTVTIGSTTMNKSLSKLSSSLSTLSLKMNSNVNINENTNDNNNNDDNNINIMMKSSGNSHTTMSNPPSSTSPLPLSHQHHSECEKIHCSQTQIVPYIINSTNPKKLEDILKTSLDLWGIDIFEVDQLTTNPLTCIFYNIVQKRNLLQKFAIPERNLLLYMTAVEEKYNNNPYHNRVHAADVVQSTHVLLNAQSLESVFTDLEIFTVLFACAIHDVGHPGVTNQYLINTNDQLAILYNDSSVLENHHLAIAFSLLGQPGHDVFENFPRKQRLSSRRMIIDMVLATDMSKHMSLLADLKTMVETKKVAGSGILTLENYIDRMQILQNMVHCADLSNPAKPLDLYRQWTNRVMEELFQQGDKERELGIEISPICDRNTATIEKSQVSFIDYIVHPLWETWSDLVYPDAQTILETLEDNREWYYNQINENNNDNNAENDE